MSQHEDHASSPFANLSETLQTEIAKMIAVKAAHCTDSHEPFACPGCGHEFTGSTLKERIQAAFNHFGLPIEVETASLTTIPLAAAFGPKFNPQLN